MKVINKAYVKTILLQIYVSISLLGTASAQTSAIIQYPVIGERCPDFFLNRVDYFDKKTARLSDFQGKWLVMDFFSKGCSSCFASFPEIDILQKKYSEEVKFLLVGLYDNYGKDLDKIFGLFKKKLGLQLSVAYDSALFEQYGVIGVPHVIVIDPKGNVRAITDGVTDAQLKLLVDDKPVTFKRKFSSHEQNTKIDFDLKFPFLVGGNGGEGYEFLYRSLLSKWDPSMMGSMVPNIGALADSGLFQGTALWKAALYNYAYFGVAAIYFGDALYNTCNPFPILEIQNPGEFEPDFDSGTNVYNYSMVVPKERASLTKFKAILQKDLSIYFDYKVSIENREVPAWKLVAQKSAKKKLQTKGGASAYIGGNPSPAGFNMVNLPLSSALGVIASLSSN